ILAELRQRDRQPVDRVEHGRARRDLDVAPVDDQFHSRYLRPRRALFQASPTRGFSRTKGSHGLTTFGDACERPGLVATEFSVVIPTYNRLDVLPEVIQALAGQREAPAFELIVVDDGSSD